MAEQLGFEEKIQVQGRFRSHRRYTTFEPEF